MARDITDSDGYYDITTDVGIVSSGSLWSNTDVAYDAAIGGLPFIYAINDARPYVRQTAPFRKDQFDASSEPGEQSLSGWWLRSQVSFHAGMGITFFNTQRSLSAADVEYNRFKECKGVNVWALGQVTLLKSMTPGHTTTGVVASNLRAPQSLESIKWGSTEGVLLHDEYDVDKIDSSGTKTDFIDYVSGTDSPVYAVCTDGTYAYWLTNKTATGKLTLYKKLLTLDSTTAGTEMFTHATLVITNAAMSYVKERIVACINDKVYEITTAATVLPTAVYTNPAASYIYTDVTASGPAIYCSGFNGSQSSIIKFTLSSNGSMPTLTSGITSAEMPEGETIFSMYQYLGYLALGTSKGVRIAIISEVDGSINYGPLTVETTQPCYSFDARDKYLWCSTSVDGEPGLIRIDLGTELDTLRFAYANDIYYPGVTGHVTTACAFLGSTNRMAFATAYATTAGAVYIESATELMSTGYLTTGNIRFGTLEPKNFKRLLARGNFDYGTLTLSSIDSKNLSYDHITYEAGVTAVEVATTQPEVAQEYLSYKFTLARSAIDATLGPVFKGYQIKVTIATPRQRIIQFPIYCFDVETDRFNVETGYEGRADARLRALEAVEENGDVVIWQDLTTGESRQCVIEQVTFTRMTPPDKRFDGQGGVIQVTIRTV